MFEAHPMTERDALQALIDGGYVQHRPDCELAADGTYADGERRLISRISGKATSRDNGSWTVAARCTCGLDERLAALDTLLTARAETPHEEWAVERVRDMAESARINASRLGVKLLKGHGYPNEVMHDAQDALALETVLSMLRASAPSTAQAEEKDSASLTGRDEPAAHPPQEEKKSD
jgi:hypothetical protein